MKPDTFKAKSPIPKLTIDGKLCLPTFAIGQAGDWPRIGRAVIRRIHPAGTIDVESTTTGNWFRITGLCGTNWAQGGSR